MLLFVAVAARFGVNGVSDKFEMVNGNDLIDVNSAVLLNVMIYLLGREYAV